jgi:excisionase family DNA binding protein
MKKAIILSEPNEWLEEISAEVKKVVQAELKVLKELDTQKCGGFLSRKDVTEILGVSNSTIHRMVNNGTLKCYKFGRRLIFRSCDIEAALVELNSKGGSNYAF